MEWVVCVPCPQLCQRKEELTRTVLSCLQAAEEGP